jgi:hypothetical protein
MATSGTVGQTVIDVQQFIDHGARRCGKLAEELTSEQQTSARESLFFLLSHLANIGINYWAISKKVFGMNANQYIYALPDGTIDVLNALYRKMNRPSPSSTGGYATSAGGVIANAFDGDVDTWTQQTSSNGDISINYGSSNPIYAGSIGVLPYVANLGSASWSFTLEYSSDGATWNTLEDVGTVTVTDDQWLWYDIDPGQNAQYYRIRAYGGTTLALREFYVGNNSTEITMARLNRDDYTNLPNKNFTANQPFQFWFDRTIPQPKMFLWPTPSDPFVQMTVWYSRQIQDVGDLQDQLEIPQRWYEAVVMMLAHRMSLELPQVAPDRIVYLEKMATQYLTEAELEERDKSPIYFSPNISVYTR